MYLHPLSKFQIYNMTLIPVDSCPTSSVCYVCLSKYLSVILSICLSSVRLSQPKLWPGRLLLCGIKINSNKGTALSQEHSGKGNVRIVDIYFPVVKYNYLCAGRSQQFMENWALLLSLNLRPTFYLIYFCSISFEI